MVLSDRLLLDLYVYGTLYGSMVWSNVISPCMTYVTPYDLDICDLLTYVTY